LAYLHKARESGQARYADAALRHLEKSLRYQRNFEAVFGLALVYAERHEFRTALTYAEEAVATMPADLEARGVLFDIHLALGEVGSAATDAEMLLSLQAGFVAWTRQATLRQYRGDLAACRTYPQRFFLQIF
jgi:tetratricopeptide (TPR) repeat protein